MTGVLAFAAVVVVYGCRASAGPATAPSAIDPKIATLAEALEDWIGLIEKDDLKTAQERWTANATAAKELAELWERVKAAHKQFDCRKWLDNRTATEGNPIREMHPGGAKQIGDATKFKVGGHGIGHLHIDWEKTDGGWRIAKVWGCR
jgi:hypothetical protein